MENEKPKRKHPRIKNCDYSEIGAYFITVCTSQRRNYFWQSVVGASIARPQNHYDIKLSEYGKIADDAINNIGKIHNRSS